MKTYTIKPLRWIGIPKFMKVVYADTPFGRFVVKGNEPYWWELLKNLRQDETFDGYEKSEFLFSFDDAVKEVEARYQRLMEEFLEEVK